MQLLLLLGMAVLSCCHGADIKHFRLMRNIDNRIETVTKKPRNGPFLVMTRRPIADQESPALLLRLTCEASGIPAPAVHWYRNDEPVYEHETESNEVTSWPPPHPESYGRIVSTLLVQRTRFDDVYTCVASNALFTERASTTIFRNDDDNPEFTERARLLPYRPNVVMYYNSYFSPMGTNIVLPCKTKGHPKPHVTWKNKHGPIPRNHPRFRVLRSGALAITRLKWEDMGVFNCTAANPFGSETVKVFVYPTQEMPKADSEPESES